MKWSNPVVDAFAEGKHFFLITSVVLLGKFKCMEKKWEVFIHEKKLSPKILYIGFEGKGEDKNQLEQMIGFPTL